MLSDLYNNVQKISTTAYTDQTQIRENEAEERERQKKIKEEATELAVKMLYDLLDKEGFQEKLKAKSEKGYFEYLLFKVALDNGVDHLASHDPGRPYMDVDHCGEKHRITYRSMFWHPSWKNMFHPFVVRYRWNRSKTLLSVYLSWVTR